MLAAPRWSGVLFTKDDILWLAEEADYPPPADPEASATRLDDITRDAIGLIGIEDATSPASEHRGWHANIHKQAIALLNAMGFKDENEALETFETIGSHSGVHAMRFQPHFLSDDESKIVIAQEAAKLLNVYPLHLCLMDHPQRQKMMREILDGLPWMIGLLARTSAAAAAHHGKTKPRRGNKPNYWRLMLFGNLQDYFEEITGQSLARLRADRTRDPKAPPVLWCQNVFDKMSQRAPDKMIAPPNNLIAELDALAALLPSTIIKYLTEQRLISPP